jgi:hypothetical protein
MPSKKAKKSSDPGLRVRESSPESVGVVQAEKAGPEYHWHYGRVNRLGYFAVGGGREVVVMWEEGGVTSQQGDISDEQWEIFKLAFSSTGRVAVLSDLKGGDWMYDYRYLEAVR